MQALLRNTIGSYGDSASLFLKPATASSVFEGPDPKALQACSARPEIRPPKFICFLECQYSEQRSTIRKRGSSVVQPEQPVLRAGGCPACNALFLECVRANIRVER